MRSEMGGSQPVRVLGIVIGLALGIAGCGVGGSGGTGAPNQPVAVQFTAVELPTGAAPVVLSSAGNTLLVGVRRDGQPVVPGLLRRSPDGAISEIPVHGATPYGLLAIWRSIVSDGDRILAIGGERGGAHGHVRWSVWSGSAAGLNEQVQGFSTFGGYQAGELLGAVLAPAGGALVGSWASVNQGFDVAVWTGDGAVWTRQSSAGTALESSKQSLGFPMSATGQGQGILVTGWRIEMGTGSGQQPVVWLSSSGNTGWTSSPLPDAGRAGAAVAASCTGSGCGVAGWVDGKLAVWRLDGGRWTRLSEEPPIAVGERDRLAAPIDVDGRLVQVVSDAGQVMVARADGNRWDVRPAAGPAGRVTDAIKIGDAVYVLAGQDDGSQSLWRADLAAFR